MHAVRSEVIMPKSNTLFEERLRRISDNGPSGVTIPGQVGDLSPKQDRKLHRRKRGPREQRGKDMILTSLLFGGILGTLAGLAFQNIVGAQVFLEFDWEAEWATMQSDMMRAAVWGAIATGLTMLLLTLPNHKKQRKIAAWSIAYTLTAVSVNAQDLFALVPPETLVQLAGN
ncbi:MAG: hypothetical protein ABJU46_15455 [Paracoccaceae bacterium]